MKVNIDVFCGKGLVKKGLNIEQVMINGVEIIVPPIQFQLYPAVDGTTKVMLTWEVEDFKVHRIPYGYGKYDRLKEGIKKKNVVFSNE